MIGSPDGQTGDEVAQAAQTFDHFAGAPMPRVSVIVPLYNKAGTISRALQSVLEQTFTDFEVLVVDDGSTDHGGNAVFELEDERFELVTQENSGPGAARNRGAREARGEYLAFLDADDEWTSTYLENAVGLLKNEPALAGVVTGYHDCLANKSAERYWHGQGLRSGSVRVGIDTPADLILTLLRFMLPSAMTIRRSVFLELGGFYDQARALYGEDVYFWLRLLFSGPRIHITLDPFMRFHREDSSLSRNLDGARPVEPFLTHPGPLISRCPEQLRTLLLDVLRARSYKTACMLGFWGDWRTARSVRKKFSTLHGWRSPLFLPAIAAGTPLGPFVGSLWRRIAGVPAARAS